MTEFRPGQRVALTRTHDMTNPPHVGRQGTVLTYEPAAQTVTVRWDDGTITEIRLAGGDGLAIQPSPVPIGEDMWQQLLASVTARGAGDGLRAADAWSRGRTGCSPEQVRGTARQILQVLDDDEDLDETLAPQYDASGFALPPTSRQLSRLLAVGGQAGQPVPQTRWRQAAWTYRDAFETAVRERSGGWARRTLIPRAGGRDLTELRPDQVRVGRVGVFSGEWMWTHPDDGPDFLRMGFVGTLIDRWNGWAVFSCTRPVAEAIVAEQQHRRAHELQILVAGGMTPQQARREVDTMLADLHFDGEVIVADQRVRSDDPEAIERTAPDPDGRYVVMGRNWCWEAVDPYRCDHIVGELPDSGGEQEFVVLTHTPGMRLPHDRLRLRVDGQWPVAAGMAFVGGLWLDGQRVATIGNDAAGGGADLVITDPAATELLRAFLAGCRFHGGPVDWPRLLDAFADEAYLTGAVGQATAGGTTLVREVDDAGCTRTVRLIAAQPAGWDELTGLAADLARTGSGRWEIWTGRSWFSLPTDIGHGS
ncbi:hypothetical protein [Actinoplanes sp. NPDC049599]|uniref:hypothetical protein n=1 Tax=Actinoplanes sp. NPDC049599 TaxID=3363903 RepID=UPI0037AAE2F8